MARQRKIDAQANGKPEGKSIGAEPMTDRIEKANPVRMLVMGGALTGSRLTDNEFIKLMNKGELKGGWGIRYKSIGPVVTAEAVAEGLGTFKLELQITDCSYGRPASEKVREAGAPDEIVAKVVEIESALRSGNERLVERLTGLGDLDPGPALGGIENAFIEKEKKSGK